MINKLKYLATMLLFLIALWSCKEPKEQQSNLDPVCGMNMNASSLTSEIEGKTYHFYGVYCKEKFEAQPQMYLNTDDLKLCKNGNNHQDYADSLNTGIIKSDTLKGSPRRQACYKDEHIQIAIDYGSPGVKDRIIWGGLVAYDKVWVAGAHNATKVTFSNDVMIQDKSISKGTYALFAIPNKEEWILILNHNYKQHLADDYQEQEDAIRINVKPAYAKNSTQRLTYEIKQQGNNNQLAITLL